jgi:putative membrane protein
MDDLAKERTHESHERTGLALERTLAAWLRTGLTMMGVGLGVAKLLHDSSTHWLVHLLGVILIIGGGIVFLLGYHTYHRSLNDLVEAGYDLAPQWLIAIIAVILFVSICLALLFSLL